MRWTGELLKSKLQKHFPDARDSFAVADVWANKTTGEVTSYARVLVDGEWHTISEPGIELLQSAQFQIVDDGSLDNRAKYDPGDYRWWL
jgi:hypothetical protein